MSVNPEDLLALSSVEKLRIVELLWDNLGDSDDAIPLPDRIDREASSRREDMRDTDFGLSHSETWSRIERRNG